MTFNSITTITRREVRETLSDWRIVLPIALLALILPQLLVAASRYVVNFLDDPVLAGRLVPFAALLVGFVPASFSLITALESFVGERERNSLEALLAMPVSDNELYVSKLCSALITPLGSSLIAMLIFNVLLYIVDPTLYRTAMTLPRIVQLVLLVALMALTMVAASVVISSHMTTIRAANLMSSFVLLPMALVVQWAAFLIINDRWEWLWVTVATLTLAVLVLLRAGLATFNREEILSREQQQGELPWRRNRVERGGTAEDAPAPRWVAPTNPLLAIMRRELIETLSDWRVLVPVMILSFGLPWALIAGTDFAIDFVGDPELIGRLVPFAALLVGFVPASFSLITALESFVGERERNSLEALLAMPISDEGLYTSKLCSAMIIPLASAIAAMLVLMGMVAIVFPELYVVSMSWARVGQLLLMIAVITLMMVAGAVVISSHTSSIRAATLLASFVLIPTTVMLQLQAFLIIARRWDMLWVIIAALLVISAALIRTGMAAFNREEILSREHEELSLARIVQTCKTFFREYQPAGIAPIAYRGDRFSPMRFYRSEFPALLRELRLPLGVALIAMFSGLLAGGYVGSNYRIDVLDSFARQVGQSPPPSLELALYIFANNLRVSILSNLVSAFTFGIFAFLVPAVAFAQIGFVASSLQAQGGNWLTLGPESPLQFLLGYVVPHGIVELPTFLLSAALGLRIGAALLAPPPGFTVGQNMLWALANFAKVWLLVLLPLVLLAALIEGLLAPLLIAALY